jgi:hypothetical protein
VTQVSSLPVADVTMVSDVPVFWLDVPGPTRAGLVFRAGWVDEDLRHRGATHLVEHLSLVASLGQQAFEFNAMVDETTTTFACSGTRDQAVMFLHAVCAGLSALPIERLEPEKRILQVEAGKRSRSTVDVLRGWRFGATGPGRGSYDEFALQWMTSEAAVAWARRVFAAGNAAAWITCPPPEGLQFALPAGGRLSLPPAVSMVTNGPSHVVASASGGLAASMLVPRAPEGAVIEWLLQRRLFERLRLKDAVSYSVDVQRRPADSTTNELFVFVDGLPGAQAELERGVLDVIGSLASTPCEEEELAQWRERFASSMAEPDAAPGLLHQMARDYLYERPAKQADNLIHEASLVTPASVRQTLIDGLRTCLYCVPDSTGVIAAETSPMPQWSTTTVAGQRFKPTDSNSAALMVVGADGVSHVVDAERRVTVPWRECAAVLRWDDGGRRVFGADGIVIDLPPHAWNDFTALRDAVDRWTPYNVIVDMGQAPPRPPAPLPRSRVLGGADTGVVVVLAVALVLCGLMLTVAGARPFLLGGIPSFALAAPCVREVYLRKKGRRASGKGATPRLSRPMRHMPRQRLLVILGLALAFTAATGLAAAGGANVGPLPFLFGFVGLTAVRELFRRPARDPRAR